MLHHFIPRYTRKTNIASAKLSVLTRSRRRRMVSSTLSVHYMLGQGTRDMDGSSEHTVLALAKPSVSRIGPLHAVHKREHMHRWCRRQERADRTNARSARR